MTGDRLPCDIEREQGNAAYAAKVANVKRLNTAPPLTPEECRKWRNGWRPRERKTHVLDQGMST